MDKREDTIELDTFAPNKTTDSEGRIGLSDGPANDALRKALNAAYMSGIWPQDTVGKIAEVFEDAKISHDEGHKMYQTLARAYLEGVPPEQFWAKYEADWLTGATA